MESPLSPITKPKTTPKDFFLSLSAIICLYASIISLINLLFEVINTTFPDALDHYRDPYSYSLRLSVATLVIIYPLYLVLMRWIRKDTETHPEKREIAVRRWLVIFTLFLAGAAIVVDLITLINTFLGGEVTIRFVLKILSVLMISGVVFGYYLYDLRAGSNARIGIIRLFRWGTLAVVLFSVIGSFVVIGSPFSQRKYRFDEQRINDLQTIQWEIVNYWQTVGVLPDGLSDLSDSISGFRAPLDPDSAEPYEYRQTGTRAFTLCATFALPSREVKSPKLSKMSPLIMSTSINDNSWLHQLGKTCFDRTIDPDRYPVRPKGF
jgi:hypothetical protein